MTCSNTPGSYSCACTGGFADCNLKPLDGCEINLNTDPANCTGCAKSCDDSNPCTNDVCNGVQGCGHVVVADSTPCNAVNVCKAGVCVPKISCGDGALNQASEECDDGNQVDNDSCNNACKLPSTITFTPGAATGTVGPTQAQCDAAYSGSQILAGKVTCSAGVQTWTVPLTGTYRISAYGAQGGNVGGKGALARGDVALTKGTVLKIAVGQLGIQQQAFSGAPYWGGGGGGGSFVTKNDNTPLVIAGGGGGLGYGATTFFDGQAGNNGGTTNGGVGGGTNGGGGAVSGGDGYGSGGGGLTGSGGNGYSGNSKGGTAFTLGAAGGKAYNGGYGGFLVTGDGGFGGGGGVGCDNICRSGGGGGYSGGQGGTYAGHTSGGGGGSYNAGTNPIMTAGANAAVGKVVIQFGMACGNGIVEAGETCDDGNAINTDACSNTCTAGGSFTNGLGGFYNATGINKEANAKLGCESKWGAGACCNDGCGTCNARGYHKCGTPNCNGSTYWYYAGVDQAMGCGWVDPNEILISNDGKNWIQ